MRRLSVPEAAQVLGITTDAVRMRLSRDTLASERHEGRVYVLLDEDLTSDASDDRPSVALVEAKDETIRLLREQLESERRANEENRRIIAGLVQRVPELEASSPSEPTGRPEAPETVEGGPEGTEPRSGTPGPQAAPQRRSLWRRVFGR